MAYGGSQARGRIGATAARLHHSHSKAGSLTHWVRPGIEPATSWFLVGFVSAAPQQELLNFFSLWAVLAHGLSVGWGNIWVAFKSFLLHSAFLGQIQLPPHPFLYWLQLWEIFLSLSKDSCCWRFATVQWVILFFQWLSLAFPDLVGRGSCLPFATPLMVMSTGISSNMPAHAYWWKTRFCVQRHMGVSFWEMPYLCFGRGVRMR